LRWKISIVAGSDCGIANVNWNSGAEIGGAFGAKRKPEAAASQDQMLENLYAKANQYINFGESFLGTGIRFDV